MPLRLPHFFRLHRRTLFVFVLAASALLSSCRSEQVAFQFRPAAGAEPLPASSNRPAPPAGLAVSAIPEVSSHQPEVAYAPAASPKLTADYHAKAQASASPEHALSARNVARRPLVRGQGLRLKAETASRPQTTQLRETGHLVLGIGLVATGVVAGVLLGGWLGLGVGAAVVILGYYFLGLAFGGKHAWQEVFQEFFNM